MDTKEYIEKCKINRSDMEDYEILGEYKSSRDKIEILHKKCGKTFSMIAANFKNLKYNCTFCSPNYKRKKKTNEEYSRIVLEKGNGEYRNIGNYKNSGTPIEMLHLKCNKIYKVRPGDFIQGYRCPYCSKVKPKMYKEDLFKRIPDIDKDYIAEDVSNFKTVHSKIKIRHLTCDRVFEKSFNNFRNGQRCTLCSIENNESKAVLEIEKILNESSIIYEKEKVLPIKYKRHLRCDFYIPDLDLYIEYDGKQHYKYEKNGYFNKNRFKIIKERDKLKDDYFKDNNLNFIRIPYTADHKSIINKIVGSTTISKESTFK